MEKLGEEWGPKSPVLGIGETVPGSERDGTVLVVVEYSDKWYPNNGTECGIMVVVKRQTKGVVAHCSSDAE